MESSGKYYQLDYLVIAFLHGRIKVISQHADLSTAEFWAAKMRRAGDDARAIHTGDFWWQEPSLTKHQPEVE